MTAPVESAESQAIRQLAKQLARIEERLNALERGRRLGYSSIEAGTLHVNDETGTPVLQVGLQEDGTYAVAGINGGQVVASVVPQSVIDEIAADLELADGAVTEAKLAAGAVTETKIADDAVSSPKVVAGAIQAGHLAVDAVAAGKIAAGAVTARELAALAVTAEKIAAGSISTDHLSVGAQAAMSTQTFDTCGDLSDWTWGGAGALTVQTVGDSLSGGTVFRAVGPITGLIRKPNIPYDTTALYRIRVRARQTVAPTDPAQGRIFVGFAGVAADGVTLVNAGGANSTGSQHWVGASGADLVAGGGWQEFVGYLRGTAAAGTGAARPDPNDPGQLHQDAKFVRPDIYVNYSGGDGTAEIDLVEVNIIPAGSVGSVVIADGSITARKIAAGAITADKLDATAITGKTITGGMFYTAGALPRVEMGEQIYEGGTKASIRFNQTDKDWDEAVIQVSGAAGSRVFTLRGPAATTGVRGTSLRATEGDWAWELSCWKDISGLPGTYTDYRFTPAGWRINDIDQGRGLARGWYSTQSQTGIGATNVEVLSIPDFVMEAGRCYAIEIGGGVRSSTVGALAWFALRKSTTTGAVLAEYYRIRCEGSPVLDASGVRYLRNLTTSNITFDLLLVMSASTGTVDHYANASQARFMIAWDVGDAATWTLATAVT